MNKKFLITGLAVALAAGVFWVGRMVYRAHYNLVTLDVYNMPLADVIKRMERQTGETILASAGLDTKVTLKVKNMPLDQAMDRLSQQAGAMWSKWHAVHGTSRALTQLESALRSRTKIEEAGWTNIAPQDFPNLPGGPGGRMFHASAGGPPPDGAAGPDGQPGVVVTRSKPMMINVNGEEIKGDNVEAVIREKLRAAGADEATIQKATEGLKGHTVDVDTNAKDGGVSHGVIKGGQGAPRVRMISRSPGANGEMTEEVWSPEHVVLEQRLRSQLGDKSYEEASETVAKEISKKVKGDLTTLYVLRKSPGGLAFPDRLVRHAEGKPGSIGTNGVHDKMPPLPDIEAAIQRAEAENYARLTPEQRVQRAREKQTMKMNH